MCLPRPCTQRWLTVTTIVNIHMAIYRQPRSTQARQTTSGPTRSHQSGTWELAWNWPKIYSHQVQLRGSKNLLSPNSFLNRQQMKLGQYCKKSCWRRKHQEVWASAKSQLWEAAGFMKCLCCCLGKSVFCSDRRGCALWKLWDLSPARGGSLSVKWEIFQTIFIIWKARLPLWAKKTIMDQWILLRFFDS